MLNTMSLNRHMKHQSWTVGKYVSMIQNINNYNGGYNESFTFANMVPGRRCFFNR